MAGITITPVTSEFAAAHPDIRQPRFVAVGRAEDPGRVAARVAASGGVGFPCVVKPLMPHWFFNSSKPFSQSARSR